MSEPLQVGDYVLATKYSDGSAGDHWCVGFYAPQIYPDRHQVVDGEGKPFRATGFRRCQKITREQGDELLKAAKFFGESPHTNVWAVIGIDVPQVDPDERIRDAAPDLLAALEGMMDMPEYPGSGNDDKYRAWRDETQRRMDAGRAAIAKARGK